MLNRAGIVVVALLPNRHDFTKALVEGEDGNRPCTGRDLLKNDNNALTQYDCSSRIAYCGSGCFLKWWYLQIIYLVL